MVFERGTRPRNTILVNIVTYHILAIQRAQNRLYAQCNLRNRLCMSTVMMATAGQPPNLHNMAGLFSLDNLFCRENPFMVFCCWSGTWWLTLGMSCRKHAKAVHSEIWV